MRVFLVIVAFMLIAAAALAQIGPAPGGGSLPTPVSTPNGGTGVASPTAHTILLGEGSSAVTPITCGSGLPLVGNGSSSDPGCSSSIGGLSLTGNLNMQGGFVYGIGGGGVRGGGSATLVFYGGFGFADTVTVTSGSSYTTVISSEIIVVKKASGSATTINLIASPTTGTIYWIKDGKGDAQTNNITIVPNSGNIDGSANYVINLNYGAVCVYYDGTQWWAIGKY
jgi:hypothetical protein